LLGFCAILLLWFFVGQNIKSLWVKSQLFLIKPSPSPTAHVYKSIDETKKENLKTYYSPVFGIVFTYKKDAIEVEEWPYSKYGNDLGIKTPIVSIKINSGLYFINIYKASTFTPSLVMINQKPADELVLFPGYNNLNPKATNEKIILDNVEGNLFNLATDYGKIISSIARFFTLNQKYVVEFVGHQSDNFQSEEIFPFYTFRFLSPIHIPGVSNWETFESKNYSYKYPHDFQAFKDWLWFKNQELNSTNRNQLRFFEKEYDGENKREWILKNMSVKMDGWGQSDPEIISINSLILLKKENNQEIYKVDLLTREQTMSPPYSSFEILHKDYIAFRNSTAVIIKTKADPIFQSTIEAVALTLKIH